MPWTSAFISFVAARDLLAIVQEKRGRDPGSPWTFFGAMAAPGAIFGSVCELNKQRCLALRLS